MRDFVVIKWGGGLITDKSSLCTPNKDVIESLSKVMNDCINSGLGMILVHGAGSFGHLRAKYWQLHKGYLQDTFEPQDDCKTQLEAVDLVRKEMLELNQIIVKSLADNGITAKSLAPHEWARNTGSDFIGDITNLFSGQSDNVYVTFGDVVDCDGDEKFGILSGDDLVVRLSIELPNVRRLVFAIGGVDGILRRPPDVSGPDDLIPIWSSHTDFVGHHDTNIDVTGGIGLKATRGLEVAKTGIEVVIVNGEHPDRVHDACMGLATIGTRIVDDNPVK